MPGPGCPLHNFRAGWTCFNKCSAGRTLSRITLTLSREEIQELINDGDLLLAAQTLREQMGDSNFYTFLQRTFRDSKLTPNAAHRSLPKLNLAAILTTNYDKLIE